MENITVSFVRPIDPKDGYDPNHFKFLEDEITNIVENIHTPDYQFKCNGLVSDSLGVANITNTIVKKLFKADIVIVDISDLNPNVMFELGLRLSLPKVTIIIRSDNTPLPFDIKDFYAISYPQNLSAIELKKFRKEFEQRFLNTWIDFINTDAKNTFIHNFYGGTVIDPKIKTEDLNSAIDKLGSMMDLMRHKYIAFDPSDRFDDFDFDHDVSAPIPLDKD